MFKKIRKNQKGDVSIMSMVLIPVLLFGAAMLMAFTGYANMGEKQAQNLSDNIAFYIASQGIVTQITEDGETFKNCILSPSNFTDEIGDFEGSDFVHGNYGPVVEALIETTDGYNAFWNIAIEFRETEETEGLRGDEVIVTITYRVPRITGFRDESFTDHYNRLYGNNNPVLDNYTYGVVTGTVTSSSRCIE